MSQTTAPKPKPCSICGQEGTVEDEKKRPFCGISHKEHQRYLDEVEESRKKLEAEMKEEESSLT